MPHTKRRSGLVAITAAGTLGLCAAPAFAWHTRDFNVVDGGEWLYGAVTVCVKSPQRVASQWRLDSSYNHPVRRRSYSTHVGSGCTRVRWKSHDDFAAGWYRTRVRVDVQKSDTHSMSPWRDLHITDFGPPGGTTPEPPR
jgi:hypothetical protein